MGWDGPMTHRQFLSWNAWIELDLNNPDKNECYLMAIAAEARKSWVAKPNDVRMDDLRLQFKLSAVRGGGSGSSDKLRTREGAARISKAIWSARLGITTPLDSAGPKPSNLPVRPGS